MNILEKLYNKNKERATHYYNLNLKRLSKLYNNAHRFWKLQRSSCSF